MMKHTMSWCQTPPSAPIRPTTVKRSLRLKRPNAQDARGSAGKSQPSQPQEILCLRAELTLDPTPVIQRVEMMAFFRLFDDDLIQDFLWMDCCCKITDKYLLAMTFVYFKRARFSISEHSRMNFFIALYLANTMEEDEEQTKYEIFPWALGKSWRKSFSDFLRQRDKLWARMEYRATVSKRCCEEVMAVMPSHFMWQRRRAEHHSGARRDYGERGQVLVPRGPSASPAPCVLCDHASTAGRTLDLLSSSPPPTYSSPTAYSDSPFPFTLCMEATPPRAKATLRKTRGKAKARAKGKTWAQTSCTQELPRDERGCGSTRDTAMNWVSEE